MKMRHANHNIQGLMFRFHQIVYAIGKRFKKHLLCKPKRLAIIKHFWTVAKSDWIEELSKDKKAYD